MHLLFFYSKKCSSAALGSKNKMIALQFPMSIAATRSAIGYWRWVMGYGL